MDVAAAGGGVGELFCGSRDADKLGGVVSAYTERRAGPALAVDAVAGNDDLGRPFRNREREGTAAAPGVAHRTSLHRLQAGLSNRNTTGETVDKPLDEQW